MKVLLKTALATRKLGTAVSAASVPGNIIYLEGELGAGKTTFVRGFLRGLGYKKHVKSPTFNLYELYQLENLTVCHFDLYRLTDPKELEYIGISDYFTKNNICLIEWPDHGEGFLQKPDLICRFDFEQEGKYRSVEILNIGNMEGFDILREKLKDENLL